MLVKSYLGKVRIFDIAPISTAGEVVEVIRKKQEIPSDIELQCQQDGRILSPESDPTRLTSPVSVVLAGGLPGGKGGFGSLLRSIGAQIEKTTNHEAMRWGGRLWQLTLQYLTVDIPGTSQAGDRETSITRRDSRSM